MPLPAPAERACAPLEDESERRRLASGACVRDLERKDMTQRQLRADYKERILNWIYIVRLSDSVDKLQSSPRMLL